MTVHAGDHDISQTNEPGEQTRSVEAIFSYPGYPSDSSNDIALLKLSSPLVLNEFVAPVCLPPQGRRESDYVGKTCYAAGWGTTTESGSISNRLLEVDVPIISDAACNALGTQGSHFKGTTMLCAGTTQGGKDACQGDSGGPLVCVEGSVPILVGVTSWGIGCGRASNPGVYADVINYVNYINQVIDGLTEPTSRVGPGASAAPPVAVPESSLGDKFKAHFSKAACNVKGFFTKVFAKNDNATETCGAVSLRLPLPALALVVLTAVLAVSL